MTFKVGDKIKCICPYYDCKDTTYKVWLTLNKVYQVTKVDDYGLVFINDDTHKNYPLSEQRFELVFPKTEEDLL